MRHLIGLLFALVSVGAAAQGPAAGLPGPGPVPGSICTTAACTYSRTQTFNGGFTVAGWTPSYGALLISAGAPVAAGTGYNVGDTITLAGGTCTTAPVVSVTSLVGGAGTGVANFWVQNPGVCSIPPIGTLTQGSSSGGGTGATFALSWGPYTPSASSAGLGYGGGNYYAGGTGIESAGYANLIGTEVTYVGVRAGSAATGSFNSAFGLNAFGTGGSGVVGYTPASGSGNSAFGTDCMRNVSGVGGNNTCAGYGALGSKSGIIYTGARNSAFGALAGNSMTTATDSVIIGEQVAKTTYSTGSYVTMVGGGVGSDTATASTSSCVAVGTGTKCGSTDTFMGAGAGGATQDNNNNSAFGDGAGTAWTTQSANFAGGYQAGHNATGAASVYLGAFAGLSAGAGGNQVYVGWTAGQSATGANNSGIGNGVMRFATSGTENDASGANTLYAVTGSRNSAHGANSLTGLVAGSDFATNGRRAGYSITSGGNVTIDGSGVGSVTCVTVNNTILIGTSTTTDCPAATTTNWLNIGQAYYATLAKPTISSGFGTSPTVPSGTSSAAFTVNVGTGGTATSGVISFATAAPTGWICHVTDRTNVGTIVTASVSTSTTSATWTSYSRTTGLASAWAASDVLEATCNAY